MIPLGVMASGRVEPAGTTRIEPIDLTANWASLRATSSVVDDIIVCTTTQAETANTLPRIQRTSSSGAIAVVPGNVVTLAAEVRHSRALPVSILFFPMSEASAMLSPRPGSNDATSTDWTPVSVEGTVPSEGAWLGWHVRVNSATTAGPSAVGDVWEIRNFRAIIRET